MQGVRGMQAAGRQHLVDCERVTIPSLCNGVLSTVLRQNRNIVKRVGDDDASRCERLADVERFLEKRRGAGPIALSLGNEPEIEQCLSHREALRKLFLQYYQRSSIEAFGLGPLLTCARHVSHVPETLRQLDLRLVKLLVDTKCSTRMILSCIDIPSRQGDLREIETRHGDTEVGGRKLGADRQNAPIIIVRHSEVASRKSDTSEIAHGLDFEILRLAQMLGDRKHTKKV